MEPIIEPNPQQDHKIKTLYAVVGVLAVALFFQTGYFLYKLNAVDKAVKTAPQKDANGYKFNPARSLRMTAPPAPAAAPAPNAQYPQRGSSGPSWSAAAPRFDEDPWQSLEQLQDRMFHMMNMARTYAPLVMQRMSEDLSSDFIPAVDMNETTKDYIVQVDLPGLQKDKIDITTSGNLLTIQGMKEDSSETQDSQSGFYAVERSYGSFTRNISLPGPVNEAGIKAAYENGVLTIILPKAENGKSSVKKIAVA
jgi:HSP20 family protein